MALPNFLDLHPFVAAVAASKGRGVILGGALGDALGLYTEFLPSAESWRTYPSGIDLGRTPFRGDGHRDKFTSGSWTDDTDHALLLVLSYLHHLETHLSPPTPSEMADDLATRLASWCEQGLLCLSRPPVGMGRTIATVALNPAFCADPHALAREKWSAAPDDAKPASNGSLMRTHPLGVIAAAHATEGEAFELAAHVSSATHADPRCTLACVAAVGIIRGILRGDVQTEDDLDGVLERATRWAGAQPQHANPGGGEGDEQEAGPPRWLYLQEFAQHTGREATLQSLHLDDNQKMGYVYKCLGSGTVTLRAAMREGAPARGTFKRHMHALVMCGGDADTNGSVAGALLGAWVGADLLPGGWMSRVAEHGWLLDKTRRFVAAAGLRDPEGEKSLRALPVDADTEVHGGREPLTDKERNELERSMVFAVLGKSKQRSDDERAREKEGKKWFRF